MRLVIAEKPSVAQSLAAVLGATSRKDGYLEGGGWLVSWCLGHLAGLADAAAYDPDYAKWRYDDLPILPESWRYTIAKDTLSHIEHMRGLCIKTYGIAEQKHYKTMYEGLLYGDPKMRILRILWTTIYNDHNARIKEEQNHGKH